jgi:hypothetical protein
MSCISERITLYQQKQESALRVKTTHLLPWLARNKMNKKTRSSRKPSEEQWKRLLEAKQDFHKMQKEILPFVKRRRFKQYSTAGKWRETSSLYS